MLEVTGSELQIARRRHDRNLPPRMHLQQIRIARNNHVGPPIQRHFQKLVVFRIAAFADKLSDRNKFGNLAQPSKKALAIIKPVP
jgi:hypothetical protein